MAYVIISILLFIFGYILYSIEDGALKAKTMMAYVIISILLFIFGYILYSIEDEALKAKTMNQKTFLLLIYVVLSIAQLSPQSNL